MKHFFTTRDECCTEHGLIFSNDATRFEYREPLGEYCVDYRKPVTYQTQQDSLRSERAMSNILSSRC